ncbi:hypothetical protein ED28_16520 [[Pantoea] beijingensis]|uniref:Uncharacterized protein n=1 Tax=[Pantoea] beijingensis TaxID=1324864 RepID=A0A443IA90_9GAMM|nr:hypothetical protein ED28_16520 [[Pantoea] beijingensis]
MYCCTAMNIAIKLLNEGKTHLLLNTACNEVQIDALGDATLNFWANYITIAVMHLLAEPMQMRLSSSITIKSPAVFAKKRERFPTFCIV